MLVSQYMTEDFVRTKPDASFDDAAQTMDEEDVRHLPVVDGEMLVGVLSDRDLLDATGWLPRPVRDVLEAPAGTVKDIMHAPVACVSPADSLHAASTRLLEWGIGCLPVLRDTHLVGILTELDVLDAYVTECEGGRVENDPTVADLMSREVVTTTADTPADEALELLRERKIRHLPVLDGEQLLGIVSDRDLRLMKGRGQLEGTPMRELCPAKTHCIAPKDRLSRAAQLLASHRIGALPVVEGGALIGILSSTDVMTHCAEAFARV